MDARDQIERAYELEENALVERYNSGSITQEQFNREMGQLQRDARAEIQEAAQDAYDDVMGGGW